MAKSETNAIKLESGNYGCPDCYGEELKQVAHADGKETYRNIYNCMNCGCVVNFTFKRDKRDQMYWE